MGKNILFVLLISLAILFHETHTEKILVVSFFSSKSHKITYFGLIEELAKRGHEITVISPIKPAKEIKNIKQIFTIDVEKTMFSTINMFEMIENKESMNPFLMLDEIGGLCEMSYDLPQVKDILKQDFDLVFVQPMFNDCVMGIVYRLKAPLVLFTPVSASGFLVNKIGGDLPPSITPNPFLGYSHEMSFSERFINFGMNVFIEGLLKFYFEPHMAAIYRNKLGNDIPSVSEIMGNASLILSNGHFSVHMPKAYLPDVVDVGGIHSHPAQPLPKDLEDFVTKSGKDGFILFSMGSALQGHQMSETKRKMFLTVFSKLKQQVIWKWESETMPDLPKNVKLSKWLPQQDILGHPNIKMFITHCGGGSTEESIYHGVPLLGLPMFGDQPMNAQQAKMHGFIVTLEWNDLTESQLTDAINEILQNSKYRDNVKRLSKIFKDQPDPPLQRGIYWIEYVMRHKGAPHLRSVARKLNYFQYHSWDVIGAYLAVILAIIYTIFAIVRLICRKVRRLFSPKKTSTSLKQKKNK